ncbi:ABC transporter substrate-binding protein [Thiorhodococcus minor]|uniref:ABC transporter substrate-binding protein n=1 Tax=Thiorhodococcus minor TaxID=57489 RepID=A0A6M0K3V9_9GAMM|nr:ABC transporter substrate-binding protein [Thiorhodococcus minor]NEV64466.1 ABC transporter substrate-binding protein [Thiorhodococcus minor]
MALVLALCAFSAQAALPTVVSTDLCSDFLLLQIAAPQQILSVSRQSQDPRVSPVAELARRYPANRGSVEDLLYLKPDIALVYSGWAAKRHAALLATEGTRLIAVPYPRDWSDTLGTTREIAAKIGRAEVGEAKAADAEQRMRVLAARARPYRMLYLRPNGGTAGQGTYVDDVIARLGLRNLAAEQGLSGWGRFPLERLVTAPPDVFLLGYFDRTRSKTGSAYGRHPLLRGLLERAPSIRIPGNAWGCGGLELVGAAEQIAAQLDRLTLGAMPARGD